MSKSIEQQQVEICTKYGSKVYGCNMELKVGISRNVKEGLMPINGLRITLEGDTSGWYIWAGDEWSDDPDFFVPLHAKHLSMWLPIVLPYLALEPGWRFLITDTYEDVWNDPELLISSE